MKHEPPITKKSSKAAMFREVESLRKEVAEQQEAVNYFRASVAELNGIIEGHAAEMKELQGSYVVEVHQLSVIRKVLELQRKP
jgi:predicted  nucleic acid-binding Zn-ribbon protein